MHTPNIRGGATTNLLIATVLLGTVGGGVYLATRAGDSASGASIGATDLAVAQMMSFDIETTASGELQAASQVELRSKLEQSAAVVSVIDEGVWAEEGQILCVLNSEALETKLDEEEAFLEEERSELIAAQNALEIQESDNQSARRDAELKLRLAELALEQWREGDRVKQRETFTLAVEKAERELARLKEQYERAIELYEQGFISKNQYDLDELAYVEAQANLRTATLDLKIYDDYQHDKDEEQKVADVDQARAELERVMAQNEIRLGDRRSQVLREERSTLRLRNRVDDLKKQIEAATIRAPSSGLVVYGTTVEAESRRWSNEGPLQIGKDIRPNELIIALPDTSNMIATVRVHESLAGRIRPGQPASVKIDALGGKVIRGTVESIGVLAESGGWRDPNLREYSVRLSLEPGDAASELKPSMRCEAVIQLGRVAEALAVPVPALFSEGRLRYVYTPAPGGVRRVPVRPGRVSDLYVEVLAGLEPGQQVLVRDPEPGSVVDTAWDPAQLATIGFTLDEDGNPVPEARPAARSNNKPDTASDTGTVSGTDTGIKTRRADRG